MRVLVGGGKGGEGGGGGRIGGEGGVRGLAESWVEASWPYHLEAATPAQRRTLALAPRAAKGDAVHLMPFVVVMDCAAWSGPASVIVMFHETPSVEAQRTLTGMDCLAPSMPTTTTITRPLDALLLSCCTVTMMVVVVVAAATLCWA